MREPTAVRRAAVVALAILLSSATSAWAALTNGDFEAGGAFWTVISGTVLFSIDEGAPPGDGVATMLENDLYVAGASLSSFEQTFTVEPGDAILSFDYALTLEGSGGPETDYLKVSVNGVVYDVASTEGAEYAGDFLAGSWSHPVSGGAATLAFLLIGEEDVFRTFVAIDNVACTGAAVPGPGAAVLVAIGLSCIASRRRRAQVL
jgi:hypothetical protein